LPIARITIRRAVAAGGDRPGIRVFFGFDPARKAARRNPVGASRFE
jgi:hypothetical protein